MNLTIACTKKSLILARNFERFRANWKRYSSLPSTSHSPLPNDFVSREEVSYFFVTRNALTGFKLTRLLPGKRTTRR